MKKNKALRIVIPLVLVGLAVGIYFWVTASKEQNGSTFTVSGTIEAESSLISPEISGKIAEVMVHEGDSVSGGDVLFVQDDTLLQAQRMVASANFDLARGAQDTASAAVTTAQTNYDLIVAAARFDSAALRAQEWRAQEPQGYTLDGGAFTQQELISAAQDEVTAARNAQTDAEKELEDALSDSKNQEFVTAEKELLAAKYEAQSAKDVLTKASTSGNEDLRDDAQKANDDALDRLEDAQQDYDDLLDSDAAEIILTARRDLVLAVERVQAAQTRLATLQTGEHSLKAQAALAALQQARAAEAQSGKAVAQAEASLKLIDQQITKLTVTSPLDGIVLTSNIEAGEVFAAGSPAVSIGRLDPLTITVYVSETEIGLLSVGQKADLRVDSWPDDVFDAEIVHIADKAEFTPRNVQTTEGRKTTVFAVKLQFANLQGQLKPGMPADVTFDKTGN